MEQVCALGLRDWGYSQGVRQGRGGWDSLSRTTMQVMGITHVQMLLQG